MTERRFSDETLMAYSDGELEPALHQEVALALANDSALRQRVESFRQSRIEAKKAFDDLIADDPDDDRNADLIAMIEEQTGGAANASPPSAGSASGGSEEGASDPQSASILTFKPPSAKHSRNTQSNWRAPLAASIALIVGGLAGFYLGSPGDGSSDLQLAGLSQSGLSDAISTVPSGGERILADSGDRFRAIATFRNQADALCREFEIDRGTSSTLVAVACNANDQWQTQFTVLAAASASGYAPASSLEALDAYLMAIGAGAPLTDQDEADALSDLN